MTAASRWQFRRRPASQIGGPGPRRSPAGSHSRKARRPRRARSPVEPAGGLAAASRFVGETVLSIGNAFTNEPFAIERVATLAVAFIGAVALWACYFQRSEAVGAEAFETEEDAGAVGRVATWSLALIVLALIAIAVADDLAIAHPANEPTLGFTCLAFGGPALFLVGQALFQHEALAHVPRSRPLGLAALAILAVVTAPLSIQGDPASNEPVQHLQGHAEMAEAFKVLDSYDATTHFNGQSTVTLDGDRATGETYCLAHHVKSEVADQRPITAQMSAATSPEV